MTGMRKAHNESESDVRGQPDSGLLTHRVRIILQNNFTPMPNSQHQYKHVSILALLSPVTHGAYDSIVPSRLLPSLVPLLPFFPPSPLFLIENLS
jgi:hypothetical protein